MVAWRRPSRPFRFAVVAASAAAYGAALQVAQLYVPERDPALRDVMPNVFGAAVGALVGAIPFFDVRRFGDRTGARAAPWILIGFWLAYRLSPFVPAIDLQEWKDSVKPLRDSLILWPSVVHGAVAWAAVGCLWAAAPPKRLGVRWLPALVVVTLGLQVLVVDNVVTRANVLGAMIGLLIVPFVVRLPGRHAVAAFLLAAAIAIDGLEPFATRAAAVAFEWLPFQGFLQGSMLINAQSLFEKAFFYGALVWFAREAGLRIGIAALGAALLLAGVEGAQTRLSGHTPEITDPLLALLAGLFLSVADAPPAPPNPVESRQRRKEET